MIPLLCLIALAGFFIFDSIRIRSLAVPERVKRFSEGLDRLILLIPLIAVPVFAVLFLFVLKGRFYERLSHAALVFALWLCAARFYWMMVSFFKHRTILVTSAFGMAGSAAAAIVLTPLNRYVTLLHSFTGAGSILVGCGLLAVCYAVPVLFPRRETAKREQL